MRPLAILSCCLFLCGIAFGQASTPFIGGAWCGNVTPTSATVTMRLNTTGLKVRLVISQNEALTAPIYSAAVNTAANTGNTVKLNAQGLQPDTDYYYGMEVVGIRLETLSV